MGAGRVDKGQASSGLEGSLQGDVLPITQRPFERGDLCPFTELPCQVELWPDCPTYGICVWLRGLVDDLIARRPQMTPEQALAEVRRDHDIHRSERPGEAADPRT